MMSAISFDKVLSTLAQFMNVGWSARLLERCYCRNCRSEDEITVVHLFMILIYFSFVSLK
jgi:hypothetical protein